jgi:transcriptional regulator GlxA family with amidase domain
LRDNCHRSVCVADAAEACAMSQRTLLRNFQTYMGTSPSEYLQRVRLERACELLAETSLPADKVARHVGLASGDRLGKLFRRCIGKSPTEYRAWTQGKAQAEELADRTGSAEHSQRAFNVYSEGQPLNA